MAVRLEPIFLANVLLFTDITAIWAFPFISKNAHEATLTLTVNPMAFSPSSRTILQYFPNINTIVVDDLRWFGVRETLPDTVTAIILKSVDFRPSHGPGFVWVNRVVEVRGYHSSAVVDLSLFPRLERVSLDDVPKSVVMPQHKLKRIRVVCRQRLSPFLRFPADCAEQVVFIFQEEKEFQRAKMKHLPPNVRVFCSEGKKGVAPDEFFPLLK